MKNLELKVQLNTEHLEQIKSSLPPICSVLQQTDTYYEVSDGRLKLRQEQIRDPVTQVSTEQAYVISYQRPNVFSSKLSEYYMYPVDDPKQFKRVFKYALKTELVVEKKRELYFIDHARIHLDTVVELGEFLEIEIVISTPEQGREAPAFMRRLIKRLGIQSCLQIDCGYRELIMRTDAKRRNVAYYLFCNKVYWHLNEPVGGLAKNSIVPCIFVETAPDGKQYILQFEEYIKFDGLKYTAWRKLIGETYNIRVDVLLISGEFPYQELELITLDNQPVDFDTLGRSNVVVDKKFLAPFAVQDA